MKEQAAVMVERGGGDAVLSADWVARRTTSFDGLTASPAALHWVESVPTEGRSAIGSWRRQRGASLGKFSVGGDLHAYGGGSYVVTQLGGWAVDSADGQVWHVNSATRCTEAVGSHGDLAYGDGLVLCVRETPDGDELVAISPVTGEIGVLHRADFLGAPRLRSGRLAWTQWDGTVMPWDSCEVWVGHHEPGGTLTTIMKVAGGPDESAVQPQWGPGDALYFMSDRTGWWNLYRWRDGVTEPVAPMDAECAAAPWEAGYCTYAFLPGGRIAMIVQRGPRHSLVIVEQDGQVTPVALPYTSIKPYLAVLGDRVALIGSSPTMAQQIALVATDGSDQVEVIRSSSESVGEVPWISTPERLRITFGENEITVLLYPPAGGVRPAPLIVRPHAGPTYNVDYRLDWEVQFFTSRGFAVVDVDYRGSTGYGRAFRKALDGAWGRRDVEDCHAVARHLLADGRALPGAVFISGASAGGYTALRAVCDDASPFTLAVARSAIVDPQRWATTAPRFQRPHAAILSHDDAKVDPDRVRRPVLILHGVDDAVAPIDDVTGLARALHGRGLLVGILEMEGVGHYFSKPASLAAALEAELAAYGAATA